MHSKLAVLGLLAAHVAVSHASGASAFYRSLLGGENGREMSLLTSFTEVVLGRNLGAEDLNCTAITWNSTAYIQADAGEETAVTPTGSLSEQEEAVRKAREAANQVSAGALETLKKYRGGDENFYRDALNKFNVVLCQENQENTMRCVPEDDADAAKDSDGNCIIKTDPNNCNEVGACEKRENCYWKEPKAGSGIRETKYTEQDYDEARFFVTQEYPKSFVVFLAPGIVLSVLAILSFVLFCCLRCCCGLCWGRNPRVEGYSTFEKYVPALMFIVFSVGILAAGGITYIKNDSLTVGVKETVEGFELAFDNLEIFAGRVEAPLEDIKVLVIEGVDEIEDMVDREKITEDAQTLSDMVGTFTNLYGNKGPFPEGCTSADDFCIECTYCQEMKDEADDMMEAIDGTIGSINDTLNVLFDQVAANEDVILDTIDFALDFVRQLTNTTVEMEDTVDEIYVSIDDTTMVRRGGVMAIFALGLVAVVLGLLGIVAGFCSRKSCFINFLHLSWIFGTFILLIGFILSSALILAAVLWSDGCNFLTIMTEDFTPYVGKEVGEPLNACFEDTPLLVALNLSDQLDFVGDLQEAFDGMSDFDVSESFAPVYDINSTLHDLDRTDFEYNQTFFDQSLTQLATLVSNHASSAGDGFTGSFVEATILAPWDAFTNLNQEGKTPKDFMDTHYGDDSNIIDLYNPTYDYAKAYQEIDALIESMRTHWGGESVSSSSEWPYTQSVTTVAEDFEGYVQETLNEISNLTLVEDIGSEVDLLTCELSCGWLTISYYKIYDEMCGSVLESFLTISLSIFLMALFLVPIVILGIVLQKRLRGYKKGSAKARKAIAMKAKRMADV